MEKKGEEIEKIKKELKRVVNQEVKLNVKEIKQPDLDAQLVADLLHNNSRKESCSEKP